MTDDELAIYRQCTGRTAPPETVSEAALIVGRRGGKSRVLALIAVCLATLRDYTEFLAPGEVATIAVLADDLQARSIFRYALGLMKAVPALQPMIEDDNTEAITLNNRVVIEISTASFRTARGYSFAAVLCDEIAFWRQHGRVEVWNSRGDRHLGDFDPMLGTPIGPPDPSRRPVEP